MAECLHRQVLIIAVVGDIWICASTISSANGSAAGVVRPARVEPIQGGQGMSRPVVEMRSIDKSFEPVKPLTDVHLTLMPGEVLGLVGTTRQEQSRHS